MIKAADQELTTYTINDKLNTLPLYTKGLQLEDSLQNFLRYLLKERKHLINILRFKIERKLVIL